MKRVPLHLVGTAVALCLSAQAQAQSTPGEEQEGGDDRGNEIVVTAQFREQNLQDTPLAISAVNAELMEARNQQTIQDVAKSVPSVTFEQSAIGGGTAPQLTIRGIGQNDFLPTVEPGVGVYVDDVYYGIMSGATFELLDLDRVEVLRGPQGTLSGKNSVGGSLKLFSSAPDNTLAGSVKLTYGSYDLMEARGSLNVPVIADRLMLRFSGIVRSRDGHFDRLDYGCVNPGTLPFVGGSSVSDGCKIGEEGGQDLAALRAAARIVWSDAVEQTIVVDVIRDHQDTAPAKLTNQSPLWTGGLDFMTPAESYASYATFIGHPFTANQYVVRPRNETDQWGVSNVFVVNLSDSLELKSITAYRETEAYAPQDGDVSPYNVFNQVTLIEHEQFTQELRLSGEAGSWLDWTLGGFYYDSSTQLRAHIDIPGGFAVGGGGVNLEFLSDDPVDAESISGFAHAAFHLTDRFNLTGGIRYTDESKAYTFVRRGADGGAPPFAVAGLNGASNTYKGNKWDFRAALDYRWSDDLLTYVQFATGFKGGGINPRPFFPSQAVPYQPEEVKTYEAGFKSDLLGRRVRLNVAGFYSDYSNMQLVVNQCDAISPFPGAPCTQTTNAASSKLWGVEIETTIEPIDGLTIDGAASFIDFEYDEVDPATGILLTDVLPLLSKTKVAIGVQYEIPAFGGVLIPRVDFDYRSSFQQQAVNQASGFGRVEGRSLVNARIAYRTADDAWEIAGNVSNLFDEFYFANRFDLSAPPFFSGIGFPGRPREFSLSVKREF